MTTTRVLDLAAVTTPAASVAALAAATAHLEPPYAVVDLGALATNARSLVGRAAGKPVRLATKSVRCRAISDAVLDLDGYAGILALTLPEALWLARTCDDVVVGYPTADVHAIQELASDERLAARVTLMVDSTEQVDLIESALPAGAPPIRVCLDLDASLRLLRGRLHLGTRQIGRAHV